MDPPPLFEGNLSAARPNLWDHVQEGVWPEAEDVLSPEGVRASIMLTFTQHNPSVCTPACGPRPRPTIAGARGWRCHTLCPPARGRHRPLA